MGLNPIDWPYDGPESHRDHIWKASDGPQSHRDPFWMASDGPQSHRDPVWRAYDGPQSHRGPLWWAPSPTWPTFYNLMSSNPNKTNNKYVGRSSKQLENKQKQHDMLEKSIRNIRDNSYICKHICNRLGKYKKKCFLKY